MANTKFESIGPTYEERIDREIIELINVAEFDGRKNYTIKEICQEDVFSFVKHEQHVKLRITRMKRDGVIKIIDGKLTLAPKPLPVAVKPKIAPAKSKKPRANHPWKAKPSVSKKPKPDKEESVMQEKQVISPDLIAAADELKSRVKAGQKPCPKISRIDEKIFAANFVADLADEPMRTIMIELADDLKIIQGAE